MAARKSDRLEVQLIGLRNIKVDSGVQSRAESHTEYVREFSEAMLRGDMFPAADVFWDGAIYWLADGFHRFRAAEKAGLADLRCNIRYGTRRDAIIFSAGANKAFSIPRTAADKRRAAELLFADSEWSSVSHSLIGGHIGVGEQTVRRWRAGWYSKNGIKPPEELTDSWGRPRAYSLGPERAPKVRRSPSMDDRQTVNIGGVRHYLPKDPEQAGAQAERLWAAHRARKSRRLNLSRRGHSARIEIYLQNRGVSLSTQSLGSGALPRCFLFDANGRRGVIVTSQSMSYTEVHSAVGRAVLSRAKHCPAGRAVVLCYECPETEAVQLARGLKIEFLTPDELIESVQNASAPSSD